MHAAVAGSCQPTNIDYKTDSRKQLSDGEWIYCNVTNKKRQGLGDVSCGTNDIVRIGNKLFICENAASKIDVPRFNEYVRINNIPDCGSGNRPSQFVRTCPNYGSCTTDKLFNVYYDLEGKFGRINRQTWCKIQTKNDSGALSTWKSPTDGKTLADLCQDAAWRMNNCIMGRGSYICAVLTNEGGVQVDGGYWCRGFSADKNCQFSVYPNAYAPGVRYCFNKANNRVVKLDGILCPGTGIETFTDEFWDKYKNAWKEDVIFGTDEEGYVCIKGIKSANHSDKKTTESTQSGCVNTVRQRECKDGEHKGYFVCESDDDCLINKTLPAHAIDGHCVSAGRNGYKICTATDCAYGWIAKGGWCQKDTISTQEGETTVAEETEEINPAPPAIEITEFTELEENCPNSDGDENECEQTEGPDQDQNSAQLNEVTPVGPSPNNESTESKEEATQQETQEVQETDNKALNNTDNQSQPETTQPTPKPTAAELEEKLKTAQDALKKAQDKENSWANRAVSATSTAASGVGGMMTASALAERAADKDAEAEMQEYISTMKCEYGKEQQFNFGADEITLPGGNELLEYYTEYKTLADNLKTTKAALGLRPGIESEVLYDRAQSGLYQYSGATRQTGGETSLFRALTDTGGADATAWSEQKEIASKKLKVGGVATAVGVGGGATGNYFINRDKKEADSKK